MAVECPLNQLRAGEKGIIKAIGTDRITKERLESLGLIAGVEVGSVGAAPLGCPRIYRVLNTLVALRNETAGSIRVEVSR